MGRTTTRTRSCQCGRAARLSFAARCHFPDHLGSCLSGQGRSRFARHKDGVGDTVQYCSNHSPASHSAECERCQRLSSSSRQLGRGADSLVRPSSLASHTRATMAKATPKATKTTAAKGTPKSAAATPSASGSASKKRVRVVESTADEDAPETPAKGANKKAKKGEDKADKGESPVVGKNGVERRDLKDKMPDEIEKIRSADAPKPEKGALKKTADAEKKGAKGKGKKQEIEQEEEEVKLDDGEEAEGSDDEDEHEEAFAYLEGFESGDEDGEDSSDEEEEQATDAKGKAKAGKGSFKVEQLPKVKGESVQKKLDAKEKKQVRFPRLPRPQTPRAHAYVATQPKTGTVYLGRIPHGFYEEEMRSYFSQFGEVTRLRLSRNKQVCTVPPLSICRSVAHTIFAPRRLAHRSTTPSSSLSTPRSRKSSRRRWTTTSSRATSSSARSSPTIRFTQRCGSERTGSSGWCRRRGGRRRSGTRCLRSPLSSRTALSLDG